jgi:hypothetical protein
MTDLGIAAKLRAAFELSPTILAVTSLDDGRLLEVNEAAGGDHRPADPRPRHA